MWSPVAQIASMQPAVDKLVEQLRKSDIHFLSTTKGLTLKNEVTDNNVGFYSGNDLNNVAVISYHSFYRFSGISCITRDKPDSKNESETIPVNNDTYMNTFMKPIIEKLLSV